MAYNGFHARVPLLSGRVWYCCAMSPPKPAFPLVDSSYDSEEIIRCIETLVSGQLTMGARVREFEQAFAAKLGAPFAVMVNSGSSANLLTVSALVNPARKRRLTPGDRVAVPAVCWSTSLWPLVQMGLCPVLIDVEPSTLNLSISSLLRAMESHPIRALMMVHLLGCSTDLTALLRIVQEHDLVLIEDTCESLGSAHHGRWLGTLGDFGTFSFYFSHHMTTIEGGMIIGKTQEDEDLLRCLRSHGWSREQSNREEIERANPEIDPRYLFVNLGYNVRPMEIQAAFGSEQLTRLDAMNSHRKDNVRRLREAFCSHPLWADQLLFPMPPSGVEACWFGFPFLVAESIRFDNRAFSRMLLERGIDTRPIVSGNMALQPAMRLLPVDLSLVPFHGAQRIHERGVYIGCHAKPLEDSRIQWLADSVLQVLRDHVR
jgi:CDP-6-deoxy-D-xylo-4-hexulose-3-dehydrase